MIGRWKLAAVSVAFATVAGWAGVASAALMAAPIACSAGGVALAAGTYEECEGAFLGNNSNQNFENEINGLFGTTGTWVESAKAEGNSWSDNGLTITSGQGASTGTFTVSGLPSTAVFVIKASNCFSAYYFTGVADPTTGSFDTGAAGLRSGQGNNCDGGNTPGISHLSVYTGGMSNVPVPAAAWLLIGGLGGLGALRMRRKA